MTTAGQDYVLPKLVPSYTRYLEENAMAKKLHYPMCTVYKDGSGGTAASVVSYETIRMVLWRVGLLCRREHETFLVFKNFSTKAFYANPAEYPAEQAIAKLYVDEGNFSDCLIHREIDPHTFELEMRAINFAWAEVVDGTDVLALFVRIFAPDAKVAGSSAMGRGRYKSEMGMNYMQVLKDVQTEALEFYNIEKGSDPFFQELK
jgi:hypothetical protein